MYWSKNNNFSSGLLVTSEHLITYLCIITIIYALNSTAFNIFTRRNIAQFYSQLNAMSINCLSLNCYEH